MEEKVNKDEEIIFQIKERVFSESKQISLTEEMIARFIGLYLMKLDIPEDLWQYVDKNIDTKEFPNLQMFFDVILTSFDEKNDMIRQMAIDFIR